LSISIADSCSSSERELKVRLKELGGAEALVLAHGRILVEEDAQEGYRLRAELAAGTRELTDANCAALLESAAVMLALSVKSAPQAEQRAEPTHGSVSNGLPQVLENSSIRPDLSSPADRKPKPIGVAPALFAEGSTEYGIVPRATLGVEIGASVTMDRVSARLGFQYLAPMTTAGTPGVSVHAVGMALLVSRLLTTRLSLGAGTGLHMLQGRGRGVERPKRAWTQLWAGRLEMSVVALERRRNVLVAVLGAGVPFVRPRFLVKNSGSVYRPSPFQLSLGLRWEIDFR
jgi:hypothetical protein